MGDLVRIVATSWMLLVASVFCAILANQSRFWKIERQKKDDCSMC